MLFGNASSGSGGGGGGGSGGGGGGVSEKTLKVLLEQLEAAKAQIIKQRCVGIYSTQTELRSSAVRKRPTDSTACMKVRATKLHSPSCHHPSAL